jgi:hypothetical protein
MRYAVAALVALAVALPAAAADPEVVVATTVKGDPGLKSIEVLGFAGDGILLVGDGKGSQVVAIMTGDTKRAPALASKIEKIDALLAGVIGAAAADIEIADLAVNPASGRVYFAVRRKADKSSVLLTLSSDGKVEEFSLKNVDHAAVALPKGEQAPISRITDVAWAGGKLIAAGYANEEFASKIFVVPGPIKHEAQGSLYSAETYHVAHGKWETKAPMSVILPYEEAGASYIVGAFACTPVVKYPVDGLAAGAKVKGISMVELGSGNRPIDLVSYTKDGKARLLINTVRGRGANPFGPSPYWGVAMDASLLQGRDKINENAFRRDTKSPGNRGDRIHVAEELHGVVQMDKLSDSQALVVRQVGENFNLEPIALP